MGEPVIPDALEFNFLPECKECDLLDLITKSWDLYGDGKTSMRSHVLSCSHLESCKAVIEHHHDHK